MPPPSGPVPLREAPPVGEPLTMPRARPPERVSGPVGTGAPDGSPWGVEPTPRRHLRLPYLPGLDGIRAIAVVGVLLYHADVAGLPGGFLGVEVFFVVSGFLITSLLLREWRATGRVDLGHFWLARARRLLPALFATLLATATVTVLFFAEEAARLRGALLAALTYTSNWFLIVSGESYFESSGRPSPLEHLWSLAVEEQFYLLWPLLLVVVLPRWGHRRLVQVTAALLVASALLMLVLFTPGEDPSRVYMGTDTRATGLLAGALLAYAWVPGRLRRTGRPAVAGLMNGAGFLALAGLVVAMLRMTEFAPSTYRWGFLVVDLLTVVLVAAVVHPDGALLGGRVLGNRVLRWVGVRSYGLYLWHWPVFVFTRPGLDVPVDGPALLALRLGLTVALAEASFRWLEMPIRRGAIGRHLAALRSTVALRGPVAVGRPVAVVAGLAVLVALVGVAVGRAGPAAPTAAAEQAGPATDAGPADRDAATTRPATLPPGTHGGDPRTAVSGPVGVEVDTVGVPLPGPVPPGMRETSPGVVVGLPLGLRGWRPTGRDRSEEQPSTPSWPELPARLGTVTSVGDSVMLGADRTMAAMLGDGAVVDAKVGRQWDDGVAVVRSLRREGRLGDTVVVHLGNNGPASPDQLDELMDAAGDDVGRVVLVTAHVPRRWESVTNETLRDGAERYEKVRIADWQAAAEENPDLITGDGIHVLGNEGARLYAATVRAALVRR